MFPSPPETLETRHEPAWYFYLAEIALRRLKNRILSSLYQSENASQGMDREEIALDYEKQIEAWFAETHIAKSKISNTNWSSCSKVSVPPRGVSVQLQPRVRSE
jgi:hypothetical protein